MGEFVFYEKDMKKQQFDEMALQMKGGEGKCYKQFIPYTSLAYITHAMVLSVCADLYSESRIIMFCWENY